MDQLLPLKKLLRIAVLTSTAIAFITMGPVYVVALTFYNIHLSDLVLLELIMFAVLGMSFFVFIFWLINVFLLRASTKKGRINDRKKRRYLWSYILCFLFMFLLKLLTGPYVISPENQQRILQWKITEFGIHTDTIGVISYQGSTFQILVMFFAVLSINTVILIILDLYILYKQKNVIELENAQLKFKNIEAVNQKLRQQLQPHFLFNSLNVLKSLIRKYPDKAETYLKRLSGFLRSSVSYDNTNTVRLADELNLCMDYLEMQKIRFGEAIYFEMNIPPEARDGFVPVFSVQPLIENAVKHNYFTTETPLVITLSYSEGWLTVSNNIHEKSTTEENTGHGLINLSERYKLISGDEIKIQPSENIFSVSIKVLNNEDRNNRG